MSRVESKTILSFQIDSEKATISGFYMDIISSISLKLDGRNISSNFCPLIFNNN